MKTIITTGLVLLLILNNSDGQEMNQVVYSEKSQSNILVGSCSREGFANEEFQLWFDTNYESYSPDGETVYKLSTIKTEELSIKVVLGTWCSDSRRELPAFYRVIDEMGFPEEKITLLCVNRSKEIPGIDITQLEINYVPTFICYRAAKEIGRIIETPITSLEKDLYRIFLE